MFSSVAFYSTKRIKHWEFISAGNLANEQIDENNCVEYFSYDRRTVKIYCVAEERIALEDLRKLL